MKNINNTPDWKKYVELMGKYGRDEAELQESDVRPQDIKRVIMHHRKEEREKKMFLLRLEAFEDENGFCALTGEAVA